MHSESPVKRSSRSGHIFRRKSITQRIHDRRQLGEARWWLGEARRGMGEPLVSSPGLASGELAGDRQRTAAAFGWGGGGNTWQGRRCQPRFPRTKILLTTSGYQLDVNKLTRVYIFTLDANFYFQRLAPR